MGFVGDDAADAAAGGGVVAGAAGDEVQVAVEDGLAGVESVVGAEIEAGDGGVGGLEVVGEFLGEAMGGGPFLGSEFAEGGDVAAGDDEGMACADGKAVAEGEAGSIDGDHAVGGQIAEGTGRIHGREDKTGHSSGQAY